MKRRLRPDAVIVLAALAVLGALAIRCVVLLRQLLAHHAPPGELFRAGALLAVLAAVAAVAGVAAVARPPLRPNIALALGSTVAALYAGELALAVRGGDWRHPADMLRTTAALRAQGRAAHPFVSPTFFISLRGPGAPSWLTVSGAPTLPLADIARSTVVACREAGDWLVFESDEHGFHNPPGMWSAPVDLAFVGDSFVHGSCVPSEANMVAIARRRVPATVNLGMPGGGPLVSLAQVREYMPALRPRTVVWCHYSGNDFRDLRLELLHPILKRYLEPAFTQRLIGRQDAIDAALEGYVRDTLVPQIERRARPGLSPRGVLALREVRHLAGLSFADPYGLTPSEEEFAIFARVLRMARAEVEAWGGRLVFAYLPASEMAPRQLGEREYVRRRRLAGERTCRIVRDLGLPVVDVAERFERAPDEPGLFACEGCHFSPRGYALAAQTILEAIAGAPR